MKPDKDGEYKTQSLNEVAALLCKKQKVLGTQRDGTTYWFIFKHTPVCEKISTEFYYGNLLVNAREYFELLKMLKRRVKQD